MGCISSIQSVVGHESHSQGSVLMVQSVVGHERRLPPREGPEEPKELTASSMEVKATSFPPKDSSTASHVSGAPVRWDTLQWSDLKILEHLGRYLPHDVSSCSV